MSQHKITYGAELTTTIQKHLSSLASNFTQMLESAQIDPAQPTSIENLQVDMYSQNILRTVESLLQITTEMKEHLLLSDFATMNAEVEQERKALNTQTEECAKRLDEINATLSKQEAADCGPTAPRAPAPGIPLFHLFSAPEHT
ncbi:hypothetical protein PAPYR_2579 [Paratrimastix pyriformis]|uniref:Mediator of RNA polymerase II transcription subunit 21 n=1 Tax=Paratrimastix pyriformis TaxID=342808 RepID=A0ABQ8UPM7_9EUKA|nr:hypothetical protein PAPYR_2579 [Paratrimastix pyriformis]